MDYQFDDKDEEQNSYEIQRRDQCKKCNVTVPPSTAPSHYSSLAHQSAIDSSIRSLTSAVSTRASSLASLRQQLDALKASLDPLRRGWEQETRALAFQWKGHGPPGDAKGLDLMHGAAVLAPMQSRMSNGSAQLSSGAAEAASPLSPGSLRALHDEDCNLLYFNGHGGYASIPPMILHGGMGLSIVFRLARDSLLPPEDSSMPSPGPRLMELRAHTNICDAVVVRCAPSDPEPMNADDVSAVESEVERGLKDLLGLDLSAACDEEKKSEAEGSKKDTNDTNGSTDDIEADREDKEKEKESMKGQTGWIYVDVFEGTQRHAFNTPSGSIRTEKWHHLLFTIDCNGNVFLYLDGELVHRGWSPSKGLPLAERRFNALGTSLLPVRRGLTPQEASLMAGRVRMRGCIKDVRIWKTQLEYEEMDEINEHMRELYHLRQS